jgi:hypothetical protein
MATSSLKNFNKYDDFLAGNSAFIPSNFFKIATVTAAGGETSLSFTSIPSTYNSLQIRGIYRSNTSIGYQVAMTFNSDTGNNYASHGLYGNVTANTVTTDNRTSNPFATVQSATPVSTDIASAYGGFITDIIDYASSSKNKTLKMLLGSSINNTTGTGTGTGGAIALGSGLWINTSAITSIQLTFTNSSTTWATGSTFTLYGVS